MQGKAPLRTAHSISRRITPAYAGKSKSTFIGQSPAEDHPRVYGEKSKTKDTAAYTPGSPPHVRGKAANTGYQTNEVWDHPRVCGEKTRSI